MSAAIDNQKTVEHLRNTPIGRKVLSLPFSVFVTPEDDNTSFVRVIELPGCIGQCDHDAVEETVDEIILLWCVDAIADGERLPIPLELRG